RALITVKDADKVEATELAKRFREVGYQLVATSGTAKAFEAAGITVATIEKLDSGKETILEDIADRKIQLVINTMTADKKASSDGFRIRETAIEHGVPLMTSLDTADAILKVLELACLLNDTDSQLVSADPKKDTQVSGGGSAHGHPVTGFDDEEPIYARQRDIWVWRRLRQTI
ncbi:hypothetical protein PY67_05305, partial [Lacticaseibacillus rhamnosus]